MSPGLQAERSFLAGGTPANIRAAGDFVRAPSRLWMNAIADGMISTGVVLLSLTAIEPVMRWAARLSFETFPQHDPVVAMPILLSVTITVLVIVSAFVKSWANGVPVRTYFADTTPPRNR